VNKSIRTGSVQAGSAASGSSQRTNQLLQQGTLTGTTLRSAILTAPPAPARDPRPEPLPAGSSLPAGHDVMRWFWIDRFEEFARCRRAVAVKCVSLAEEHLHDHFPGVGLMPNSLVLEGMAQTAGLLVADAIDFGRQVVLAKVAACEFQGDPIPGDVIRFETEIQELTPEAAFVRATTSIAGAPHGTAEQNPARTKHSVPCRIRSRGCRR